MIYYTQSTFIHKYIYIFFDIYELSIFSINGSLLWRTMYVSMNDHTVKAESLFTYFTEFSGVFGYLIN